MTIAVYQRRRLRQDSTDAEATLWRLLRGRRFHGYKFRRQHSVGPYILDFYCADRQLAVELDGGQHLEKEGRERDAFRDRFLKSRGIAVLRIATDLVFREREQVMRAIGMALGMDMDDPLEEFDDD